MVFLPESAVGEVLFISYIRQCLTTSDLMRCSQVNLDFRRICRTYTLPEVWMTKGYFLGNEIELETRTADKFGEIHLEGSMQSLRPRRLVLFIEPYLMEPTWWWTFVYHPDHELAIINTVIEDYIQEFDCGVIETEEPMAKQRLVSATFGKVVGSPDDTVDVTGIVRDKIVNGRLQLLPPRPSDASFSLARTAQILPTSPTWWWVQIFGDPYPRRTKILRLTVERVDNGRVDVIRICENRAIDITLLAE